MEIKNLKKRGGIGGWVRWCIREKVLIYLSILALIVVGGVGLIKMNKDEFPTFQIKQGLVAGIYPGATAEEVEAQLTKPLEEYLFTFKEVNRNTLYSVTRDGICYIYVDLRDDVPQSMKDEVWSKIKLGLQTRKMTLPPEVLAVAVLDDFGNTSSLLVALESSDKSYFELQDYADELCSKLRQIPELAKAEVVGTQQEEIAVTLDREKLSAYGIDPGSLMIEYQAASLSVPAGSFENGPYSLPVHIRQAVGSEREVAEHIIYSDPMGNVIRLKDVATIERRYKKPTQVVSYNGNSCLIINIEMRPDNDIVAFGDKLDAVLDPFAASLPPSVTLSRILDQPKVVSRSVWSFLRDLLISMLVVILVMLMLFPMRSALIASSGVPVCTAIAIAMMYLMGMPLNTVTLAALIVVLGMIVDDSIITMDGYMEQNELGRRGPDAAAASAQELFLPTFIATLAICLMFFPILGIITGYLGDFVSLFPWVILISLMTSLFYAVSVVPSLEVRFITPENMSKKNAIGRVQDKFFAGLQRVYERCLDACFRHPAITICCGFGAVGLGLFFFSRLNVQMMPMADRDYFIAEIYMEGGNDISCTRERSDTLTKLLLQDERVRSVTAFTGTNVPRFSATYTPILPSPQTSQLIVTTRSTKDTETLLRDYEKQYLNIFPDALVRFKQMDYQGVEAPIAVKLSGDDREALLASADKIAAFMHTMDDQIQWVHHDADNFAPSVNVTLDTDEASRLGVSKAVLSLSLSGALSGATLASIWEGDKEIPVCLYSEDTGAGYLSISDQLIPTAVPGVSVPLRQVAIVEPDWHMKVLRRENGRKTITVMCDLQVGESQPPVEAKIRDFVDAEILPDLPEGAEVSYGGLSAVNADTIPEIAKSFIAACSILLLFLLIHFKKANIAILTMVLSSLCLFGAALGLLIFGLDFSITAVLGLISLVGIIVRNGILMFEYAEDARFKEGKDVRTAAMLAGQRRMRPIFLTSCTTALGVLPMIISGDLLWMPMGVTICFGTLLTIFLITLIMPVSYWQIFKKADKK